MASSHAPGCDVVSAASPAGKTDGAKAAAQRSDNLVLRVLSSAVLAPLTVAVTFVGGGLFVAFWTIAAIGVAIEWARMIAVPRTIAASNAVALALAGGAAALGHPAVAAVLVLGGALLATFLADPARRGWVAAGVLYAGAVLLPAAVLRSDGELGLAALLFLFAVVWATDIFGYFGGRLVGGPKLWVRVSPKKTWAGAIAGGIGAVLAGCGVALVAGLSNLIAVAVLALLMSAVSQAGDLIESAVKRKCGVKDAGQVIPGHGGIMDRLDGFLVAASVAALIGLAKGGFAAPARALLTW